MSSVQTSPHIYDLLIIGGGPVGLLTALGAYSRGARNIAVVDQTTAFRLAGDLVDVQPNAMRALRTVSPRVADAVRVLGPVGSYEVRTVDCDGRVLEKAEPYVETQYEEGNEAKATIRWSELQRVMLDAMPEAVVVETGLKVREVENVGGRVRVECVRGGKKLNPYVNWGNDPLDGRDDVTGVLRKEEAEAGGEVVELQGRVVIGADGVHSVCRAAVYREIGGVEWEHVARAEYAGYLSLRGDGKLSGDAEEEAGKEFDDRIGSGFVHPRKASYEFWAPFTMIFRMTGQLLKMTGYEWLMLVHLSVDEDIACRKLEVGGHARLLQEVLSTYEELGYPDCFVRIAKVLFAETNDLHKCRARPLYIVPVIHPAPFERRATAGPEREYPEGFYRPFGHGGIILAGDSLHGMPPSLAQGTAMGFEDCCELVDILAKTCGWSRGGKRLVAAEAEEALDEAALKEALNAYRSARVERLAFVQRSTMNLVSPFDKEKIDARTKQLMNFVPFADGWPALSEE